MPGCDNAAMTFLRFLMLLALVIWIGGIVFFAFVVAPALFGTVPSRDLAGAVVGRSLGELHWIGVGCAIAFLVCSLVDFRSRIVSVRNVSITLMLALTLISQIGVIGRMERLRASMGSIAFTPPTDARRVEFEKLHSWSTTLEGLVLLLGLVALFDTTRCISKPRGESAGASAHSA